MSVEGVFIGRCKTTTVCQLMDSRLIFVCVGIRLARAFRRGTLQVHASEVDTFSERVIDLRNRSATPKFSAASSET